MLHVTVPPPQPDSSEMNVLCEGVANTTLCSDADFEANYALGDELGRGGWATVFSARRKSASGSSPPLAVKVMDKLTLGGQVGDLAHVVNRMRDECRVLSELAHPRVVKMIEIAETPHCVYIVMQKAAGGALLERILERGVFSEAGAKHVIRQVLEVLSFMHAHGVIHRDIKPENILLDAPNSWDVVITDFGLVKIFSDRDSLATSMPSIGSLNLDNGSFGRRAPGSAAASSTSLDRCDSRVGSPFYRAPEQVFCVAPYPTTYGAGVDVWAAGVVLYILLGGTYPFEEADIPPPPLATPSSAGGARGGGGGEATAAGGGARRQRRRGLLIGNDEAASMLATTSSSGMVESVERRRCRRRCQSPCPPPPPPTPCHLQTLHAQWARRHTSGRQPRRSRHRRSRWRSSSSTASRTNSSRR